MAMAGISSTSGLQAVTQTAFQQVKLQQARQNAERAEQVARNLRSEAAEAQHEADRAQDNARTLMVRSNQAQSVAGQARQGLAMMRSVGEMQDNLSNLQIRTDTVSSSTGETGPIVPTAAKAPVVNTSGQVTGIVVNTTA
jgi:ABC-type hemin transport system substrate-binding protein